jgi:putative riboflavin transport system substrate-binding protein
MPARTSRFPRRLAALALTSLMLLACTPPAGSAGTTKLAVGLGYIPSVQFAQFYLAQQKGYYAAAGLDVSFDYQTDVDVITLLGRGAVDVGIADGTSVIPAVAQGVPIRYVATIYGTFPNVVFAKASSGISSAADLKGRKIGTPGQYGSSWIMLQALLQSAGLSTSDVNVLTYPDYGQGVALQQGAVEAATGYTNNEPVQLELSGTPVSIIHVDQIDPLPGPGLIVGTQALDSKQAALAGFVAATLRAMREIVADPSAGYAAASAAVPELAKDPATQQAVLAATIATWQSPYTQVHGLGAIDRDAWARSITFMSGLPDHPVAAPVSVDQVVDEGLLGG